MNLPNLFLAAALLAPAPAGDRSFDFICSTPSADGYGRVVVQDWDLSRYERNPVVLWNHGQGGGIFGDSADTDVSLPIGRASNVRVEGGELRATITLVDAAANPLAEKVFQGLVQGSISAVSVGWQAADATYDQAADVLVLSGNELLEISVVAIPANADAVRASDAAANGRLAASLLATHAPAPGVATPPVARLSAALEGTTWRGKRFAELSFEERAELAHTDLARYEAMRDGRSLGGRGTDGERAVEVLLATTGAPNVDAAFLVLAELVDKAAKYDAEVLTLRAEAATAKAARVDEMCRAAMVAGRLTPAMRGMVLRAAGAVRIETGKLDDCGLPLVEHDLATLDIEELERTLARMPQVSNTEATRARTGAPQHAGLKWGGKTYAELSFEEKHDLAIEDYELFKAMRAEQ